jgi:hypothetical protein
LRFAAKTGFRGVISSEIDRLKRIGPGREKVRRRNPSKKKQAASERIDKLKAAGGESWSDIKSGLDSAMADLNTAFDEAASNFAKMRRIRPH